MKAELAKMQRGQANVPVAKISPVNRLSLPFFKSISSLLITKPTF
jgi:hypothetical protein